MAASSSPLASPFVALFLLCGCGAGSDEDRQPTAAEVKAYTEKMERDEARARAVAIRDSRAKEEARDQEHQANMSTQD